MTVGDLEDVATPSQYRIAKLADTVLCQRRVDAVDMLVGQCTPFSECWLWFGKLHVGIDLREDGIGFRGESDAEGVESACDAEGYAALEGELDEERVLRVVASGEDARHIGPDTSGSVLDGLSQARICG